MTNEEREIALYCLKVSSDYHSELCEECVKYPNCDHTIQDDVTETIIKALEQQPRWIPVSERLPEDGTWNIWQSTTGALSIERYKEDAYDHFCPSGRFFQLDEAVAWMPLPERYKTESEEEECNT